MIRKAGRGFEEFLRHLALIGIAAFILWLIAGASELAAGYLQFQEDPAVRFMTAVLVLVLPSVVYPDLRALRYRSLTAEERLGLGPDER